VSVSARLRLSLVTCALGFAGLVSAGPAASPAVTPPDAGCVLQYRSFRSDAPCAPFTVVKANVLATFSQRVFWGGLASGRQSMTVLDDGTVMIAGRRGGLFRIDRQNHVVALWTPSDNNYGAGDPIQLLGPIAGGVVISTGNLLLGVREDGSLQFRKQVEPTQNGGRMIALQDRDGTVWMQYPTAQGSTTYAYVPRDGRIEEVPQQIAQGKLFPGSDHRVFASTTSGIFELISEPHFSRRLAHAVITLPPGAVAPYGIDAFRSSVDIQAAGSDGSLWGSTLTQIVHVHPDGAIRVLRLIPPIIQITMLPQTFDLAIAPDGSVWNPATMVSSPKGRSSRSRRMAARTIVRSGRQRVDGRNERQPRR
jgi:hypothetical protein